MATLRWCIYTSPTTIRSTRETIRYHNITAQDVNAAIQKHRTMTHPPLSANLVPSEVEEAGSWTLFVALASIEVAVPAPTGPPIVLPPGVGELTSDGFVTASVEPQLPVSRARSLTSVSAAGVEPQSLACVIQTALLSMSKTAVPLSAIGHQALEQTRDPLYADLKKVSPSNVKVSLGEMPRKQAGGFPGTSRISSL